MAVQKPKREAAQLKEPDRIDLDKADELLERIIDENLKWLKEMAKR